MYYCSIRYKLVTEQQNQRSNSIDSEMKPNDNFIYLLLILLISWACKHSPEINCNDVFLNVEIDNNQSNLTSECGASDGKLVFNVSSSFGSEIKYSVDNGFTFQKDSIFEQLKPGEYLFGVKDLNGCISAFKKVIIFSGISFQAEILPIIKTYCSLGQNFDGFGCHVPGGRANSNFEIFSEIQAKAQELKQRVSSRNMPRSNSMLTLTDEQIEKLVCWVDDGALDN